MQYSVEPTGYGFYTFMSIAQFMGSTRDVPIGTFDDYYSYADVITTNIFSIYRGLVIDFGLLGGLLYMYVSGFLLHLSYYQLLIKRRPSFSVALFIVSIAYYYMSTLVSLWGSNSIPVTTVLVGLILSVNHQRCSIPRRLISSEI
jgi:oligosaccharide repeat unit polymerase